MPHNEDNSGQKEILSPVTLELPVRFGGKYFTLSGATDHSNTLGNLYNKNIMHSPYADANIYSARGIHLPGAPIDAERPKIFGFWNDPQWGIVQGIVKWMTEIDWAITNMVQLTDTMGYRKFPNTEIRLIGGKKDQITQMLTVGLGVFAKLTSTRNLIWIFEPNGSRHPVSLNGRSFNKDVETLAITEHEPNLWDTNEWLENDNLLAALAQAYVEITSGKLVRMVKTPGQSSEKSVLIAQALSQMTAARLGRLPYWVSEHEGVGDTRFHLAFINSPQLSYPMSSEVVVDPNTSRITSTNQKVADQIREAFSQPLPEALKTWAAQS